MDLQLFGSTSEVCVRWIAPEKTQIYTWLIYNKGVGKSSGWGSWRGGAEQSDVLSVAKFLLRKQENQKQEEFPKIDQIVLVGYSYGSVVTSSVANEMDEIKGFVAISYPFGVCEKSNLC